MSIIGDPLGQALDKGLKPVGLLTGGVGKPTGEGTELMGVKAPLFNDEVVNHPRHTLIVAHFVFVAALTFKNQAKEEVGLENPNKPDSEKAGGERIGGKEQTGSNPLGL